MYTRYVVGYDGSSPSEAALSWAVTRAHRASAPLLLVNVAEGDDGNMGLRFEEEEAREGAGIISRRLGELQRSEPDLDISGHARSGSVPWELARACEPGDLLIVGTHKTGFLHGRVLGSRGVQIASAAPCSVAVIPEVDLHLRSGVVAGIDLALTAAEIAELAADEADLLGDELVLLQAAGGTAAAELAPLAIAKDAARLRQPGIVIRSRASSRSPAEALLDASRGKALLVLGPGSGSSDRSPIGSVLHDVLLNVNAPVLIARVQASVPAASAAQDSGRLREAPNTAA